MRTWSKAVLRTVGALDAILSTLGLYFLLVPIRRGLFALNVKVDAPDFKIAFITMLVTNAMLLLFFILAVAQLLGLKKSGVTAHAIASALLVAYDVIIGALWVSGGSIGGIVAAATGVANLGIAPFQCFNLAPYVYPIASTVLLLVTRRMIAATSRTWSAGAQ